MYVTGMGREPTAAESVAAIAFLERQAREYGIAVDRAAGDERVWADLAHVIFNVKEFVIVN
jgi:hypothetical protein